MDWTAYLFGFEGRINRAKMWLSVLVVLSFMMIFVALVYLSMMINFVAHAIGTASGNGKVSFSFDIDDIFHVVDPASWRSLSWACLPTVVIKAIGTSLFAWIYFATAIKRLHDRDKSAWWMLPFFVAPGLFNQFAGRLPDSPLDLPLALTAFALCLWGFVEMFFLKGSPKTNRFGPDPLLRPDTRPPWKQASEIEMVPHKASPPPVWRVNRSA